ncbi:MAG: class I SAM-dependent methyltransferase [Alphaproteobacteria bacterium]|nr:class I SAM-dependent methyltransferase [Alphaproteobacteria bacterium]
MLLDARELQAFYETRLGQASAKFIRRRLRELWPSVRGEAVVGLGYALPYLRPFRSEAARTLCLMPAQQGAQHWPPHAPNLTALFDEAAIPLPDASMDRIIVAHLVENTESLRPLLRQVWRVLTPQGRVIFIVPNRTSLWAQFETTPFGHGRPFTRTQLQVLLADALFTPTAIASTLFMPPFGASWLLQSGTRWNAWGQVLWPKLAGVHLVEATKEVMSVAPIKGHRQRVPFRPVLAGQAPAKAGRSQTPPSGCPSIPDA